MITNMTEFFDALHEDYLRSDGKEKESSFLFSFQKKQKEKKADRWLRETDEAEARKMLEEAEQSLKRNKAGGEKKATRFDRYLLLQQAYEAQKKEVIPFGIYREILGELSGEERQTVQKWKKAEDCKRVMEACGRRLLIGDCDSFLYDAGYRKDRSKGKVRKNYEILEMFFAYEQETGASRSAGKGQSRSRDTAMPQEGKNLLEDREYIDLCEALYRTLLKHPLLDDDGEPRNRKIFLPIYIDPQSGAQIALVGADHYGSDDPRFPDGKNQEKEDVLIRGFVYDGVADDTELPDQKAYDKKAEENGVFFLWIGLRELEARFSSVSGAFDQKTGLPRYMSDFYDGYVMNHEMQPVHYRDLFEVRRPDGKTDKEAGEKLAQRFRPFFFDRKEKDMEIMEEEKRKEMQRKKYLQSAGK
ncbi:MAG: hypothetical protein IJP92_05125 [Lachnospiraceae bacterium]|nr:hypothetical protein [Lachnospiraceae bacterium]